MAEGATPEEKTELPSERRVGQLRREGQIHLSQDVVSVASLLAGFMMISIAWSWLFNDLKYLIIRSYTLIGTDGSLDGRAVINGVLEVVVLIGPHLFAVVAVIAAVSTLAVFLQTKWNIKEKKLKMRFDMLNPINGIKRIVSISGLVSTLKAILKLALILPIAYYALKGYAPQMVKLTHMSVEAVLVFAGMTMHALFWKIAYILIALAIFDYFWTKHQWFKQNKMTKEEVKDERKAVEGDETTKRKIVAKGLQRIMQRINQTVPKADVIVTNPTHYAVALKYDRDSMVAPTVVAKGKGFLALRIREIAKESGIPILERKALARALYASTEVGSEIPRDLFKAVAEVLAYVFRLKNPYAYRSKVGANN